MSRDRSPFRLLASVGLLLAFAPALADSASAARASDQASIASRAGPGPFFHEMNFTNLAPGEAIEYTWTALSDGSLTFDVHWHDKSGVKNLVGPLAGQSSGSGTFTVPDTTNVFLLWENKAATGSAVRISYEVKSVAPPEKGIPAPLAPIVALLLAGAALTRGRRLG